MVGEAFPGKRYPEFLGHGTRMDYRGGHLAADWLSLALTLMGDMAFLDTPNKPPRSDGKDLKAIAGVTL